MGSKINSKPMFGASTASSYGTPFYQGGVTSGGGPIIKQNTTSSSGGNLNSNYIKQMSEIIALIANIRTTPLAELQGILTKLVGYQQALPNFYKIAVDPTNSENVKLIYQQMTKNDPFLYLLFFAYNLCDYQIIQYELIISLNNSRQNYANLLNAQQSTNNTKFSNQLAINLTINTGIKLEYLNYIKFYGIPAKGYFIPSILERIRLMVITDQNYTQFNPMTINIADPVYQEWVNPASIVPVLGTNETVTTTTDNVTGKTTTTIINTNDSGNILANITIIV
jgi:hypothetical protein